MLRIRKIINQVLFYLGSVLLAIIFLTLFLGVIYRYLLNNPLRWTNELATIALIWLVFISGTYAFSNGQHISIDVVVSLLGKRGRLFVLVLVQTMLSVFFIVLTVVGAKYTIRIASAATSALRLSQAYLYAAIPVCCLLMFIISIDDLIHGISLLPVKTRRGSRSEEIK